MPVYSRDHMMPVLAKRHWLPIRARVSFKIATTVFKVRQTRQLSYLAELIEDAVPSRTLRSSASRQCILKESRTVLCYGTRAFRHTAAKTWNSLPDWLADKLETFRSRLKTHLYRLSYCWLFPVPEPTNSLLLHMARQNKCIIIIIIITGMSETGITE